MLHLLLLQDCGVFEIDDVFVIAIDANIGVTNTDIDQIYGMFTCTITHPEVDVTVSASVTISNCGKKTKEMGKNGERG